MPRVEVNGVQIFYEFHGPDSAPVLILNNGVIMNAASSWIFQTKAFSAGYRVLQYDCRGQGQSDHPEEAYSMRQHADDLAELMDVLEIEYAHVLGISYGGEVAQAFGLAYPEKTISLILADTVSEVGPELRMVIQSWVDALKEDDPLAFFYSTVSWNFGVEFIEKNEALLDEAKQRYALLDFPAVIRLCEAFFEVDFTDRLGEINVPVCIIVGQDDLLKGVRYARKLKAGIPHAELHILDGSGHVTIWERPEEFNTVVLGFLGKMC